MDNQKAPSGCSACTDSSSCTSCASGWSSGSSGSCTKDEPVDSSSSRDSSSSSSGSTSLSCSCYDTSMCVNDTYKAQCDSSCGGNGDTLVAGFNYSSWTEGASYTKNYKCRCPGDSSTGSTICTITGCVMEP